IAGTLTLNAGGVLNNPGTIRAGTFVNNGGTINGSPPSPPPPVPVLQIRQVQLVSTAGNSLQSDVERIGIELRWTAAAEQRFAIESSTDLRRWTAESVDIRELAPGQYSVTVPGNDRQRYYRVQGR